MGISIDPRQQRKRLPSVGGAMGPTGPVSGQPGATRSPGTAMGPSGAVSGQPGATRQPAQPATMPSVGAGGAGGLQYKPNLVTTTALKNPGPATPLPRPPVPPTTSPRLPNHTPNTPGTLPSGTPPTPNVPGVGFSPINPQQDMRGSNILPQQTERLSTSQTQSDAAAGRVADFDMSGKIGGYQEQFAGPDTRSQIARDRLAQFDLESEPLIRDRQRAAVQNAFRNGRGGMGDEFVNALNPFTDYLTRRAALSHGLAADTAEGEISDRFGVLDRSIGVAGNERLGDIGAMSELERRSAGIGDFESGMRDEYRGERDYEQLISRQAMEDAIREQQYGDARRDTLWNQDLAEDALAGGFNPAGVYQGAAANYGAGSAAGYGNAGDLFAQWLARNRGG